MPQRAKRLLDVPEMPEVGGYVNRDLALKMLGLAPTSKTWLYTLVLKGEIQAAYFDDRTLMYSRRSIEDRLLRERKRKRGTVVDAEHLAREP